MWVLTQSGCVDWRREWTIETCSEPATDRLDLAAKIDETAAFLVQHKWGPEIDFPAPREPATSQRVFEISLLRE